MKTCERCGAALDKKQVNELDSTIGRKGRGEKLKLCRNCIFDKFSEYLSNYTFRAVMIYPIKDKHVNAYVFYDFETMSKGGGRYSAYPRATIDQLRNDLPPPNTVCQTCGRNNAKFTWTSPEIYRNNYVAMKFSPEGTYDKKYLCPDCLLEQWKQKIIENDTKLDLLFPPVGTDRWATSWDV